MYVYIESEKWFEDGVRHHLYTTGFYKPNGRFEPDTDHDNKEDAAARVHYLNGGSNVVLNEMFSLALNRLTKW